MHERLRVDIASGSDPGDRAIPYVLTVTCSHGVTRLAWRRVCRNGCHRGPALRAAGCMKVNPSPELLTEWAVCGHGRRLGCGCDEVYWMQHGPEHPPSGEMWVQADERRPDAEAWGELLASGPSPDPWAPVC